MKSKRNLFNVAVCLISGIIVAGFVFFSTDLSVLKQHFSALDLRWIAAALGLVVLQWLFEGATFHVMTKPFFSPLTFRKSFELQMGGLYFNAITPFATGGQPFQAYSMTRMGMDLGDAMSVLLSKFLVYQAWVVGVSTAFLVTQYSFFTREIAPVLREATGGLDLSFLLWIGYIINTVVFLIALVLAVFPNVSKKFAAFFIWILGKMRFLKDPKKTKAYFDEKLENCGKGFQFLIHNPSVLIRSSVTTILYLLSYVAVPYTLYRAFDLSLGAAGHFSLFAVMGAEAFVMLVSSFFPLPGASGGAEAIFYFIFLHFFAHNDDLTKVAMILWRIITFYLTIAVGVFFVVRTNRSNKKAPQ